MVLLKNNQIKRLTMSVVIVIMTVFSVSCNSNGNQSLSETDAEPGTAVPANKLPSSAILFSASDSELFKKTFPRKFEQVPSIAVNSDGKTIYVAYYSGGEAAGPGNFVTVSISTDEGNTWKNDELIVFPATPSIRIFDPGLWRDNNQHIHLFYGTTKDSLLWDGFGGVNEVEIRWDGSKIVHTTPARLADGVMINKPVSLAADGRTLFATYTDRPPEQTNGKGYPENGSFIFSASIIPEKETSLTPYSSFKVPDSINIHDEPQLVETGKNGELLVLVRTTKGIYYARSSDYGKTWSSLSPFDQAGPTTSSRSYIGRLRSGNLLLIANNSTAREKMTAFLSKDGGKSWPYKLLLDGRQNVSYPDADQSEDGTIHVVFDRDRTGDKDILYCRFTEDDIVRGDVQSVFRIRVNQ